jgi:hypothetical protein
MPAWKKWMLDRFASSLLIGDVMTNVVPTRLSKSALSSLICGLLVCVPFVTGALAVLLGMVGFVVAGRPERRGRWMAVVGVILGVISIGGWSIVGVGSLAAWRVGKNVVATLTAPGDATHDFIQALAGGDEAAAKAHAALSAADYDAAKTLILAQGGFVDSTFNSVQINEGGGGHVSGTVRFKARTMRVNADLTDSAEGWRVTSIEMLP